MATQQSQETFLVIMEQPVEQVDLQVQTCPPYSQLQIVEKSQTPIQGFQLLKLQPEDDPEAFLMMFECAAEAAMWPKEDWAMHLTPLLSREALPILQDLPPNVLNNYTNLKNIILHDVGLSEENYRKQFRSLTFTEGVNPQTVAQQLRDWAKKWLKPETRSPAEIVELIVVEQFLHILPEGAGEWLNRHQVWSLDSAVELIEAFLSSQDLRPCSGGDSVQTFDTGEEPLTEEIETEPVIILRFEDVLPDSDPQFCKEGMGADGSYTGFVAIETENLPEAERREELLFGDLQDHVDLESVGEEDTSVEDYKVSMDGALAETEPSGNSEETVHQGYNDTREYHKTILDQATDIFLQCAEQTVLFNRQNVSQRMQLRSSGNQQHKATGCEEEDKKSTNSNNHPTPKEEKTCLCTRCGNIYSANSSRVDPLESLTWEKLYTCSQCESTFDPASEVVLHEKIKIAGRAHVCTECGKSFKRRLHLSIHRRKHTGEKPFSCFECGKNFNQLSNLVRHQQVHSDTKPYPCNQCTKSFRRPSQLKRHQFIHTDRVKNFKCDQCGQKFTQSFNLLSHQRKKICSKL